MSIRRLIRRYGFPATVAVGLGLLGGGSWVVYDMATRDVLAEASRSIEEGRPAEARGMLQAWFDGGVPEERQDEGRILLARAIYEENAARDTLTREALGEVEEELRKIAAGSVDDHFALAWKVQSGYAAIGENALRMSTLDWLGGLYPSRAAVDLEKARALVELGPVHELPAAPDGPAGPNETRFEARLSDYSAKSEDSDRDRTIAFLRAAARQRSAAYYRVRAVAREYTMTLAKYREEMEWVLAQEQAMAGVLEAWLEALPAGDRTGPWARKAELEVAGSLLRQVEVLERLRWKWVVRYGAEGSTAADSEAWASLAAERHETGRAVLERVVSAGGTEAADLRRARFLLADLHRRAGRYEEAAAIYEVLAGAEESDRTAREGFLRALLGRARIAIDLAAAPPDEDGREPAATWKDVESILARFEEEVEDEPELLAEAGRVHEDLRDRRIEAEERELATYERRHSARPELGRARRQEVVGRVAEVRQAGSRKAAALYWAAAQLTRDNALRIESDWRAAENFRVVGNVSTEILALQDFIQRADNDPRPTAALYHLGRALERRGHFRQAEDAHRRNVDLYPATPFAYRSRFELARLAERRADYEEALRRYASIRNDARIEFDPQSRIWRNSLFRLASVYERMTALGSIEGGLARADELYREAIRRYPTDPRAALAWFRLGWIGSRRGRHEEAAVQLRQAIALSEAALEVEDPAPATGELDELEAPPPAAVLLRQARYALGDVLYQGALAADVPREEVGRRLEVAFEAYEEAVGRHPGGIDQAWGYYQEAQIRRLQGDVEQGKFALEKVKGILERVEETGGRERPEGFDPAYWAAILEWETRFRRENAG